MLAATREEATFLHCGAGFDADAIAVMCPASLTAAGCALCALGDAQAAKQAFEAALRLEEDHVEVSPATIRQNPPKTGRMNPLPPRRWDDGTEPGGKLTRSTASTRPAVTDLGTYDHRASNYWIYSSICCREAPQLSRCFIVCGVSLGNMELICPSAVAIYHKEGVPVQLLCDCRPCSVWATQNCIAHLHLLKKSGEWPQMVAAGI